MSFDAGHYRGLERMYLRAPNNRYYEPEIHIAEGMAEIRIAVRPEFFHAAGAVHGSVYFKAMDDAAFFAANSVVKDVFVLTTGFDIHLLRPVTDGTLVAVGSLVSATKRLLVAGAELRDDSGRLIGSGTGTFMPSRIRLVGVAGYTSDGATSSTDSRGIVDDVPGPGQGG